MAYNNFYPSPNYNGFFGNGQQYGQMNNQNVPNSGQPNGYQNVNYPHLRSLRSLRSGGLSLSGSENDFFKSPTSLECHKAN